MLLSDDYKGIAELIGNPPFLDPQFTSSRQKNQLVRLDVLDRLKLNLIKHPPTRKAVFQFVNFTLQELQIVEQSDGIGTDSGLDQFLLGRLKIWRDFLTRQIFLMDM